MFNQSNGAGAMSSNVVPSRRYKANASDWLLVVAGILILCINFSVALPVQDFYPFNITGEDNKTSVRDDGGSPALLLETPIRFFNSTYTTIYVNNNGIISFDGPLNTYKPLNLSDKDFKNKIPFVAPFWADVDIENVAGLNESIVYRVTSRGDTTLDNISLEISRATNDIRILFPEFTDFTAKLVVVVTWYRVGFFGAAGAEGKAKRNTFQTVLVTNGTESFALFHYDTIVWTTGANSGGTTGEGLGGSPAVASHDRFQRSVGFHSGFERFYVLPHSGVDAIVNVSRESNVCTPGRFVFRISGPDIDDLTYTGEGVITVSPSNTSMLGGSTIRISGPCFTVGEVVPVRVPEVGVDFNCEVGSFPKEAVCVTPPLFRTGQLTLLVNTTRGSYRGNITSVNMLHWPVEVERENRANWVVRNMVDVTWPLHGIPHQMKKELHILAYRSDQNGVPSLRNVSGIISVEPRSTNRRFRLPEIADSDSAHSLVISLCWRINAYQHVLPICVWSDVFPVRWLPNEQKQKSQQWCEKWLTKEKIINASDPVKIRAPNCPCVASIAERDVGHFHPDPFCDNTTNSTYNCEYNKNAEKCFTRNIKSPDDSGETCCYNAKRDLMDIRDHPGAGTHQRYNYQAQATLPGAKGPVPFFSFFEEDVLPRLHCCEYSDRNCSDFIKFRQATTCQDYSAPSLAQAAGDPHIVTLDGKNYSFNGVGDFYLVMDPASSTSVQVRAVQVTDINGNLQSATVFSHVAVAMRGSSDTVEIRKSGNGTDDFEVLLNHIPLSSYVSTSRFTNISLSHNNDGSFLIALEPVSVSVRVEVTPDLLNIIVMIGEPDMKGRLRGLLGNYNGKADDDFIARNETVLLASSTMRTIHYGFGMTWKVPENESILSSVSSSSGKSGNPPGPEFSPLFIDENPMEALNGSTEMCKGNQQCIFDFLVTRKESVALATMNFTEKFSEMKEELAIIVIRCPFLETPTNGNKTQDGNSVNSTANFTCNVEFEMQGSPTRRCDETGKWTGSVVECVKKVSPSDVSISNAVLIGAAAGSAGLLVVVIISAIVVYLRRRRTKKPDPPDLDIELTDLSYQALPPMSHLPPALNSVTEHAVYTNYLQEMFRDGRYRLPRPRFVNPEIFDEFF
ncbi:protein mesh-like isoform X2 [Dreissena polymorpha]|uniref:protein mesh-like isoform X2 n=1 Tax=Dreissena polymorpha TaxID=45954 RepID=UPI00226543B5|nr:protein mesh-like isoform X2 [Dreissena polymorpha]